MKVLERKGGESFSREAIAVIRKDRVTRAFVVDLVNSEISSVTEIPGPGQPTLVLPELFAAIDIALTNEEMRAGLAKRGVVDLDAVFCGPRTGGNFGEPEQQTRRIVKVDCLDMQNNATNAFATPVEGLPAWTGDRCDVEDTGIVLWYTMGFHHVPST